MRGVRSKNEQNIRTDGITPSFSLTVFLHAFLQNIIVIMKTGEGGAKDI